MPPLRERRDAVAGLARQFLAEAAGRAGRRPPALLPSALTALCQHDWPGNVRELRAVMERALLVAHGDALDRGDIVLDAPLTAAVARRPTALATASGTDAADRARLVAALEACRGNQVHAARQLGISRSTLIRKMAVHAIASERLR